jgi:hypothetical protein
MLVLVGIFSLPASRWLKPNGYRYPVFFITLLTNYSYA